MSDAFYRLVRFVGRPVFRVSAAPIVLGTERVPRASGADHGAAFILASTHESPYDVALLIRHTPRLLDFVSIVECPDNETIARVSVELASRGSVRLITLPAMPVANFVRNLKG